jgi:2-dehydro-3-deoxyphosphogluconate aldolase/(4S)-4-hydroxy-2-oxoglutarate aldolase
MLLFKKIEELRLIPVAVLEDSENAIPLSKTLIDAGLPVIEITFRTKAAAQSISEIKKEFPEMLVGAGTVLNIDQVDAAIEAGSEFIVSPGFNPTIIDYCIENKYPIIPGIDSPSFIEWGLERGLDKFKFFPAEISGGLQMLKSLYGPYPQVKFIPTGGINYKNIKAYLELDNVIACGGSWVVNKNLISSGEFDEIKRITMQAISIIKRN